MTTTVHDPVCGMDIDPCAGYLLIRRFFGDLNRNFCQHLPAYKPFSFTGMS
jgi:hypothetical protein